MSRMTRGKFLGAGVASASTAAGVMSPRAVAEVRAPLDSRYRRSDPPQVTVAYPRQWHLYPRLVTDLTAPAELFSISNEVLIPGPSFDESGLPNASALSETGVLMTILAQRLGPKGGYSPGPSISAGVALDSLTMNTSAFPNVDQRSGWYLDTEVGYLVLMWSGRGAVDLVTADAILRSFRPL
jgi:hypothetical protein